MTASLRPFPLRRHKLDRYSRINSVASSLHPSSDAGQYPIRDGIDSFCLETALSFACQGLSLIAVRSFHRVAPCVAVKRNMQRSTSLCPRTHLRKSFQENVS